MSINDLYNEARSGDGPAEGRLFEQLSVRFRLIVQPRISSRHDREEIVQEALKTVAEKYAGIRIHTSFAAWCCQILDHKIGDYIRRRSRQSGRNESLNGDTGSVAAAPERPQLENRLLDCLRQVCRANRRYARVLVLHYQGYTTTEICNRLNLTATNFYVLLSRARDVLAECVNKEFTTS